MNGNTNFSFGSYEWKKTLKGLLIAVAGAVLAYFAANLGNLSATNYAWLIPLMSGLVNMGQLWIKNNQG